MFRTLPPLIGLEGRILFANRMAIVVLVGFLAAAVHLRFNRDRLPAGPRDVCYVLYWEDGPWIQSLKVSALKARAEHELTIEVQHADTLTGDDGTIRYPSGACSIQIHPLEAGPDRHSRYKIWYWYAGADPGELWPYAQWFQGATRRHFQQSPEFVEETSPLHPELVVLGQQTRVRANTLLSSGSLDAKLVALVLFFVAAHLPLLSLSTAFEGRVIYSLAASPAGWEDVAGAKRLFYGALAIVLAATVTLILRPFGLLDVAFWFAALCAAVMYLGVAFTLASLTNSVAAAGVGVIVYAAFAGLLYATTFVFPAEIRASLAPHLSPELGFWRLLESAVADGEPVNRWNVVTLALWANLWHQMGAWSYRRRARR